MAATMTTASPKSCAAGLMPRAAQAAPIPVAARIGLMENIIGHDLYQTGQVTRQAFEIRAVVQPGNSGGPLLSPSGTVYGVVFSAASSDIGFALTAAEVANDAAAGATQTFPVSTQGCDYRRSLPPLRQPAMRDTATSEVTPVTTATTASSHESVANPSTKTRVIGHRRGRGQGRMTGATHPVITSGLSGTGCGGAGGPGKSAVRIRSSPQVLPAYAAEVRSSNSSSVRRPTV
jgi:hypothetical protein